MATARRCRTSTAGGRFVPQPGGVLVRFELVLVMAAAMGVAGCNNSTTGPAPLAAVQPADGYVHYASGGRVQCDGRPVAIDGAHTRVEASGPCSSVRVTGEHNDVIVEMAPAGLVDVSGAHNDVWWRTPSGAPPRFRDTGASNSFHRDEG